MFHIVGCAAPSNSLLDNHLLPAIVGRAQYWCTTYCWQIPWFPHLSFSDSAPTRISVKTLLLWWSHLQEQQHTRRCSFIYTDIFCLGVWDTVRVYIYMYIYMCIYICVYMGMSIYTYIIYWHAHLSLFWAIPISSSPHVTSQALRVCCAASSWLHWSWRSHMSSVQNPCWLLHCVLLPNFSDYDPKKTGNSRTP
jgi:hypothetical protein